MSLSLYLGTVDIDGAMTAGSHDVATHVPGAVVGMYCDVLKAGPNGSTLVTSVTAVAPGVLTLGYAASVTVTSATVTLWKPYAVGRYSLSGEVSSLSNRPSMSFSADKIKNAFAPRAGQPVLVLDLSLVPPLPSANQNGDVFGGSISDVRLTQVPGDANAVYDCSCVSWEAIAGWRCTGQPNAGPGRQPIDGKFTGMAAGAVFEWIANVLDADISKVSVVTGPTIPEITVDYTYCSDAFSSICAASSNGTDTYVWRADARRNLFFEIQTTSAAPWDVANDNILTGYAHTQTLEKYANSATVTSENSAGGGIDNTLVRTYNNNAAIDLMSAITGGTGYREMISAAGDANQSIDPGTLAESIAKTYGVMPDVIEYSTHRGGLRAGHLQNIVIVANGISGYYLIDSVNLSMSSGVPQWQIHAVDGALIGDWKTALAGMSGSGGGYKGGFSGGGSSGNSSRDLVVNILNSGSPGAPYVLDSVQQVVNVTATTQDVYALLPDEGAMAGLSVCVNLSPGSTHPCYLRVHGAGDNIQGDTADHAITAAGTSITIKGT